MEVDLIFSVLDRQSHRVPCRACRSARGGVAALWALLVSLSFAPLLPGQAAQKQAPESRKASPSATKPSVEEEEARAIEDAVRSSDDNPQVLTRNLEDFLKRFPASNRRELVLHTIYKLALQANDPQMAAEYAEKLLELTPDDRALLSSLIDLLDRQGDASNRAKALRYASRLIEDEEKDAAKSSPSEAGKGRPGGKPDLMLAGAYLTRGKLYAKAGETDKARADFQRSYAVYPSAQLAERLGDLAVEKKDLEDAVREYAIAFVFPEATADPAHQERVRRKLGKCYVSLYQSEKGLGDLLLARYDDLVGDLAPRFKDSLDEENSDLRDPLAYVLERPDGSSLRLTDYRGKVVIMEFWATWCGPCRAEGKLFGRVEDNFRNDPEAVFLAVNVDEDRTRVPAFLKGEKWTTQVAYAGGLDRLLGVQALPTLVIFDRNGRVAFRQEGLEFSSFVETLNKKIRQILGQPASAAAQ